MSQNSTHNSFIFNQKFDTNFIFSLYEDDFGYIEEIFGITLGQLLPDLEHVEAAHESGDRENLRKAVHKIKPSFGFVGLLSSQEVCKNFEGLCHPDTSAEALETNYNQLWSILLDSKTLITEEYQRIQEFNQRNA